MPSVLHVAKYWSSGPLKSRSFIYTGQRERGYYWLQFNSLNPFSTYLFNINWSIILMVPSDISIAQWLGCPGMSRVWIRQGLRFFVCPILATHWKFHLSRNLSKQRSLFTCSILLPPKETSKIFQLHQASLLKFTAYFPCNKRRYTVKI